MNTKLKACLLSLLFPVLLQGQEIGLLRMSPDSLESRASAAVWGGIEEGQFRPVHGASLQWSAGADAKTVRHGEKTSWTGALSLEQTTGYHMNSSMLLEPDYYPLDILETTQGTKSRQIVRLEGGVLTDFGYELAAGIKVSAQGAHTAKSWNLTHQDLAMTLQAEPTLTYVMDEDMGLVSSYIIRLRTENLKIKEEIEGDGFRPFLDKGMLYGSYLPGNAFQIQEFSHGFNELLHSEEFNLGLSILWKRGKASTTGGTYRFPGSTLSAFGEQTIQADMVDHVYRISYKRQRDQLREVTEGGLCGLSDRRVRNLNLRYDARFLHGVLKNVAVVLDGNQWFESAQANTVRRYDGTATLETSFSFGSVDLDLGFLAGKGWWTERGRTTLDDGSYEPGRLTETWLRKMDYQMVPRTGVNGTLTCRIPAVQGLFVQLYGAWYRAFHVTYLPGKNREIGKLTIGYNF